MFKSLTWLNNETFELQRRYKPEWPLGQGSGLQVWISAGLADRSQSEARVSDVMFIHCTALICCPSPQVLEHCKTQTLYQVGEINHVCQATSISFRQRSIPYSMGRVSTPSISGGGKAVGWGVFGQDHSPSSRNRPPHEPGRLPHR